MQQRLALAGAAEEIARLAVALDLADVAADRLPAADLALVLRRQAAAHIVAAVPLEPAARIVGMNPAVVAPHRERLAGVDSKKIEGAIAPARRELGTRKPRRRKLLARVGHVLAAEHPELQHLLRRELRLEFGIEVAAHRCREGVAI